MDYTEASTSFKIKKTLRYIRIYGIRRTLAKVNSHYHMKKEYDSLPSFEKGNGKAKNVGVIGCGKYAYAVIAYFLNKKYGNVLRGVMDIDIERAASLFEEYNADYYTDDEHEIINDDSIDIVYIASNHASHAEYAISALREGKNVHIEKPHAVTVEQLERLCTTMEECNSLVRLGFNRPESDIGKLVIKELGSQSGKYMFNWFIAGHKIDPDNWYFDPGEGGRILGNMCHWIDFIFQALPPSKRYPIKIIPARSDDTDCDISVSYVFGDGSIGTITFSAKGHTFEGVRERLNAHRGNVLASINDFEHARVDILDDVVEEKLWNRDHGHESSILTSYQMAVEGDTEEARSPRYVWDTGYLSLMTKKSLESFDEVVIEQSYQK